MATDVTVRQFKDMAEVQAFMDQYGLTSSDIIAFQEIPDGVALVFNATAVDMAGPRVKVAYPQSAEPGAQIFVAIQPVSRFVGLAAITDDPDTSGVSVKCRVQGSATWHYPEVVMVWHDLYRAQIPREVVASPGVEFSVTCRDTAGNSLTYPESGYYTITVS